MANTEFDWKCNKKNSPEALAAAAAKVMYYPGNEQTAPLQYVIEYLVTPPDTTGYTEEEMAEWILQKLTGEENG